MIEKRFASILKLLRVNITEKNCLSTIRAYPFVAQKGATSTIFYFENRIVPESYFRSM